MKNPEVDAEFVLAHQGYVKSLAKSLVFDETLADDLEQQVWLAALQHPPAHGLALRGWLSTIARNLASSSRRASVRSGERERESARRESVAAADELVAREQMRTRLVQAVLALEEPFREAIILRYFDELSPRAIAARQGVPLATVKSRLKRGLAALRARLDREGGGRAAWCLAFVHGLRVEPSTAGLAVFSAKSFATGVALMTATQKFAAAVLVLAACLVVWRVRSTDVGPDVVAQGPDAAAPELVAVEPGPESDIAAPAPELRRANVAGPVARAAPAAPKTGTGDIDVTVLAMPGRTPLADVSVSVHALQETEPRLRTTTARTDASGVAHFEKLAPADLQITCDRGYEAFGLVRAGERTTKTLLVEKGGDVTGRVVDEAGQPVEDAEIWFAKHDDPVESFRVASSGAGGRFAIHDVKPTSVYVFAKKRGHAPSTKHANFVNPGAAFEVELALRGPAGSLDGFVRDARGAPVANALVVAGPRGAATWLASDGRRLIQSEGAAVKTDELGRYEFDGLLAGASDLYVHALEFLDANDVLEVASGAPTHHDVRLLRGTSLSGSVVRADGKAANGATIQVRALGSGVLRSVLSDETGAYQLDGLESGPARVTADLQQLEFADEDLTLREGEDEAWSPKLSTGLDLAGRVLDESGKPAAKVIVYVRREAPGEAPFVRAAPADREGRFRVKGCRDAECDVTVYPKGSLLFPLAEVRGVRPGGEELVVRLDPSRTPSAFITGHVVGPDGRALGGVKVTPSCATLDYNATQLTAADGTFRAGPFPAGLWSVSVEAEGLAPLAIAERELAAGRTLDLGTIALAGGDVIDVTLVFPAGERALQQWIEIQGLDHPVATWCKVEGDHGRSPPLAPGRYRLVVEGAYAACTRDAEVVAGRETKLEIELKPGVAFAIRLDDETGDPQSRKSIVVRDVAGGALLERSPRLGRTEPIQFPACLAPGHYRIEAADTAGRTAVRELDVDEALAQQTVTVELR